MSSDQLNNDSNVPNSDGLEFDEVEDNDFDQFMKNDVDHEEEATAIPQTAPRGNLFRFVYLVLFFGIWFLWLLNYYTKVIPVSRSKTLICVGWPIPHTLTVADIPYFLWPDPRPFHTVVTYYHDRFMMDHFFVIVAECGVIYCALKLYRRKWILKWQFSIRSLLIFTFGCSVSFYYIKGAILLELFGSAIVIAIGLLILLLPLEYLRSRLKGA